MEQLERTIDRLAVVRAELQQQHRAALLDLQVVREDEYTLHQLGIGAYSGTLVDIVRAVAAGRAVHEWIGELPPTAVNSPPLTNDEALSLLDLLRTAGPERVSRRWQQLPDLTLLPDPIYINTAFAHMAEIEDLLGPDRAAVTPLLDLARDPLTEVVQLVHRAADVLADVGLSEFTAEWGHDDWRLRAAGDQFERRNPEYWATQLAELQAVTGDRELQAAAAGKEVQADPRIEPARLLGQAKRLRSYLLRGRRIRRYLPPSTAQRDAAELVESCTVDGVPPDTPGALAAVISYLNAEATVLAALQAWPSAEDVVSPTRLSGRLARLRDIERGATAINTLIGIRDRIEHVLRRHGVRYSIRTAAQWDRTVRAIQATPLIGRSRAAQETLDQVITDLMTLSHDPHAAPEVVQLIAALRERDIAAYSNARVAVGQGAEVRARDQRCTALSARLRAQHPDLVARLTADPHDSAWDRRLKRLGDAWNWACAGDYVKLIRSMNGNDAERKLNDVETQLGNVTAELAAARALLHCLIRVTAEQRGALQDYQTHMSSFGRGHSDHGQRRLSAARSAMRHAQAAVPAWIMPLANVVETIDTQPNAFDVVIVDEASQAGVEALFLLCLAPRVVIVGDDRQCAPGLRNELADVHESLHHHLAVLEDHRRESFNPVSNLYELLSARSTGVIRLREHFRCMPEIIGWSSRQFYQDRLVPLRQFGADRLDPIKVVHVSGAVEQGTSGGPRNSVEAEAIVDQIEKMLIDPAYRTRSIGVVVLQGTAQRGVIDRLVQERIDPADIRRHRLRVGQPPDFQGDERDVILLSMTIARPRQPLTGRVHERRFNVAASRARDQLWLFTSIGASQLKPDDMRHSLLTWMKHPPTLMTIDPSLDQVNRDELRTPFTSLLQQQVFLDMRQRGYAVIAQFPISGSTVDLVVVGDNGRLGIECETPERPTTPEHLGERLLRDRSLSRAGWQFFRVKHSDYLSDPNAALAPLWTLLRNRGIEPRPLAQATQAGTAWAPAPLSPDEAGTDEESDL